MALICETTIMFRSWYEHITRLAYPPYGFLKKKTPVGRFFVSISSAVCLNIYDNERLTIRRQDSHCKHHTIIAHRYLCRPRIPGPTTWIRSGRRWALST